MLTSSLRLTRGRIFSGVKLHWMQGDCKGSMLAPSNILEIDQASVIRHPAAENRTISPESSTLQPKSQQRLLSPWRPTAALSMSPINPKLIRKAVPALEGRGGLDIRIWDKILQGWILEGGWFFFPFACVSLFAGARGSKRNTLMHRTADLAWAAWMHNVFSCLCGFFAHVPTGIKANGLGSSGIGPQCTCCKMCYRNVIVFAGKAANACENCMGSRLR